MDKEDLNKAACDLSAEKLQQFYKEATGKEMPIEYFQKIKEDVSCPSEIMFSPGAAEKRFGKINPEELQQLYREKTGKHISLESIHALQSGILPPPPIPPIEGVTYGEGHDPVKDLSDSIFDEWEAIMDYTWRAINAAAVQDPKTHDLFIHIAKEEAVHAKELEHRRNELYGR
jgi:hypothetical protein